MSEEETTPETIAHREHLRYLTALYRLGLHDTMRMIKGDERVYIINERPPYRLKFF